MTIVLHHYPTSPFAELVRVALGLKGLDYRSVTIPQIMPKPDLVALTGGYARTPVLQIDADIYCDSSAALDALEALPGPTLYPAPLGQAARMIASFAGGALFLASVGGSMGGLPPGAVPQAFIDDRKARMGLDMASLMTRAPHLVAQFGAAMAWLDLTLADGRAFVGGDEPGHADFALYMNPWFARLVQSPAPGAILDALPSVVAWMARVAAGGHGSPTTINAATALDIARAATPDNVEAVDPASGFAAGQNVTVRNEGPSDTPVAGTLLRLDARQIVVLRDGGDLGPVAVHWPRFGYAVVAA